MSQRYLTLDQRLVSPVAALCAISCLLVVGNWAQGLLPGMSGLLHRAAEIAEKGVLLAIGIMVLRIDGGKLADIGLSRRFLLPGIGAFLATYGVVNGLGVGVATVIGRPWGVGVLADRLAMLPTPLIIVVFFAFVEEVVFRGYLQTKLRVVLDANGWPRRILAVIVAAALFALLHIPRILVVGGYVGGQIAVTLVVLTLSGIAFGLLFELSGNLYFVGLIHALGNSWVLLIDGFSWGGTTFWLFVGVVLVAYLGVTVAYRRVAAGTEFTPHLQVRRRGAGST